MSRTRAEWNTAVPWYPGFLIIPFVLSVPAVWCPSRPRVRWRPGADRPEILHQQRSSELPAQRTLIHLIARHVSHFPSISSVSRSTFIHISVRTWLFVWKTPALLYVWNRDVIKTHGHVTRVFSQTNFAAWLLLTDWEKKIMYRTVKEVKRFESCVQFYPPPPFFLIFFF